MNNLVIAGAVVGALVYFKSKKPTDEIQADESGIISWFNSLVATNSAENFSLFPAVATSGFSTVGSGATRAYQAMQDDYNNPFSSSYGAGHAFDRAWGDV